jgi:hypothetical protein
MNMRPFAKPYLLCAAALLLAQPAWAVDDGTREAPPVEDETDESVTYSGIGLSYVGTDFDNVDDAINLGVVIGFRIPTVNIFAVELELSTTVIPGQIDSQSCSTSGGGGGFPIIGGGSSPQTTCVRSQNDFGTNSAGVYAVLRSPGRFYAMGKIGTRYVTTSIEELDDERGGSAYAGGIGYRWNPRKNNGVELFYNKFSDSLDMIGFSVAYGFGGRD